MLTNSIPQFFSLKDDLILQLQQQIYISEIRGNIRLTKKLKVLLLKHPLLKLQVLSYQLTKFEHNFVKKTNKSNSNSISQNLKVVNFSNSHLVTGKLNEVNFAFSKLNSKKKNFSEFLNVKKELETQLIIKIIEPLWESRFSVTSYGGRPGRCCYDSIIKIHQTISPRAMYFSKVNFDFKATASALYSQFLKEKLFAFSKNESINLKYSNFLLEKLYYSKTIKKRKSKPVNSNSRKKIVYISEPYLVKLKTIFPSFYFNILFEMLESELIHSSYLLMQNYFLNEVNFAESKLTLLKKKSLNSNGLPENNNFSSQNHTNKFKKKSLLNLKFFKSIQTNFEFELPIIRFGTDLVILNSNLEILNKFLLILQNVFDRFNLCNIHKIEIGHTLLPFNQKNAGLTFLNFEIHQKPRIEKIGFSQISFNSNLLQIPNQKLLMNKINFVKRLSTTISPSQFAFKEHITELKAIVKTLSSQTQEKVIFQLTPKIRFWSNYFKISTTKKLHFLCDFFVLKILWRWACRRHSKKSRQWIREKYFHSIQGKNWQFAVFKKETNSLLCLPQHAETNLILYQKINEEQSPYLI